MYNPKLIVLPIKKSFKPSLVNMSYPFNNKGSPKVTPRSVDKNCAQVVGKKMVVTSETDATVVSPSKIKAQKVAERRLVMVQSYEI